MVPGDGDGVRLEQPLSAADTCFCWVFFFQREDSMLRFWLFCIARCLEQRCYAFVRGYQKLTGPDQREFRRTLAQRWGPQ